MAKAKPKAKTGAGGRGAAARAGAVRQAGAARAAGKTDRKPAAKAAKPGKAATPAKAAKPAPRGTKAGGARPRGKTPAPARAPTRPPQRFTVSHLREDSFAPGLRRYAQYRDLGIAVATGGLAQAHVIRFVPPCRPEEVSKLHYHDVELQMVFVLNGWIKSEFENLGAVKMEKGSAWIQPPRIKHKVLDYSDDCEVLEIILPAQFDTVELE